MYSPKFYNIFSSSKLNRVINLSLGGIFWLEKNNSFRMSSYVGHSITKLISSSTFVVHNDRLEISVTLYITP